MKGTVLLLCVLLPAVLGECEEITKNDALIIIDMQNDFMEPQRVTSESTYSIPDEEIETKSGEPFVKAGSLAVTGSTEIIPVIHDWIKAFQDANGTIMMSLDWHPANHCSFCRNGTAASNPNFFHPHGDVCLGLGPKKSDFDATGRCSDLLSIQDFNRDRLIQWPDHCVQTSFGARTSPFLRVPDTTIVLKKGLKLTDDSYSAFGGVLTNAPYPFWDTPDTAESLSGQPTLGLVLAQHDIRRLFVVGVATDVCVKNTALDAIAQRFGTVVVPLAASRGVGGEEAAKATLIGVGVKVIGDSFVKPSDAIKELCKDPDAEDNTEKRGLYIAIFSLMLLSLGLGIGNCVLYSKSKRNSTPSSGYQKQN